MLRLFVDKLATAVVSCDSPRFLSFIPAAPTKAALLFDMFVSCSSLHGTSWLEAAGVVVAENQALRVIADLAGLPAGAGGCFVAGGSAGNLSALVVARDTAGHRRGGAAPASADGGRQRRGPLLGGQGTARHRRRGVHRAQRRSSPHRGRTFGPRWHGHPRADDVIAVVATAGTTNAGIIDDLAGVADVAAARQTVDARRRGLRRCRALRAERAGPVRRH